ncbi:hypothetical protein [Pedobacter metabolipauper]|uniref:Uncharacterized protein n=1 Tax=Pedobacter metabolipauper TaxID=425513 RepID=A0A4R6SUV8_9SPHI|nr:hypothetical protein [Pedobacter metabolipauper]TDQ08858.1 hypothetical protein ATK78_3377 [Pedobacter metabolipauper]
MSVMSFVFFGLMLIPLIIFLVWIIRKDKKRNYLGLSVLVFMAIIAIYAIVKFDSKFIEANSLVPAKSQAPSYR